MSHRRHVATGADRHRGLGLGPSSETISKRTIRTWTALSSPGLPARASLLRRLPPIFLRKKARQMLHLALETSGSRAHLGHSEHLDANPAPCASPSHHRYLSQSRSGSPRHTIFQTWRSIVPTGELPSSGGSTPVAMVKRSQMPDRLLALILRTGSATSWLVMCRPACRLQVAHSPHYCRSEGDRLVTARHSPSAAPTTGTPGASAFWRKSPTWRVTCGRVLLFDATHHHAQMARLDHHPTHLRSMTFLNGVAICRVSRSCTCKRRANTSTIAVSAQSQSPSLGYVGPRALAKKGSR